MKTIMIEFIKYENEIKTMIEFLKCEWNKKDNDCLRKWKRYKYENDWSKNN